MKKVAVIICAAGASKRFGGSKKKPFVDVSGRAAFLRSIEFFADRDDVKQTILAISPQDDELVKLKWGANLSFNQVKICHGGPERFETVANALKLVADDIDLIAVHDAVRCCLKAEWVEAVIKQAAQKGAAILACPVVATIKKAAAGKIVETVDRRGLYEVQTPQVFDAKLLKEAYEGIKNIDKASLTDDSSLVEALGREVSVVETDTSNIKITRKSDVAIAEAIIKSRPKPKPEGPVGPYIEAQW
ncbi:MAG: 2-C-methyl-D-erythritol 4-phosphate cytidylyltransferase [Planctomycetota bacterium]|nr:MAG: 2-C-methyl-D-erythritol 4-phosphate cytidylyltransferase [Planctomycetota bacterium]